MRRVVWEVSLLAEVEDWFLDLCERDPDSAARVAEAIDLLEENGRYTAYLAAREQEHAGDQSDPPTKTRSRQRKES